MNEIEKIKKDALVFFGIDINIKNEINKLDKIYKFKYYNINYFILYKNNYPREKIDKIVKRVYKISQYYDKTFNIYLLLTPLKKLFNNDIYQELNASNINSGFTYLNMNTIYLIRMEELPKVILHELIHHNKLIHSQFKEINIKRLKECFKIDKRIYFDPNEAIVEFWAMIIHLYFISIEYKLDFYELYKKELNYSLIKSKQILNIQKRLLNNIWVDKDCHIFAYIIFKTIFLFYLDEFYKIYTFPYSDDVITEFLISHYEPFISALNQMSLNKLSLNPRSLRFMLYSNH
jgi:hypothetical protein